MGGDGSWWRTGRAVVLALLVVVVACGDDAPPRSTAAELDASVTVASFNFDESELLGELYAQSLEAAGLPVDRELRLGARELVSPAIEQGLVDVVPEYVGSGLTFLAPERPSVRDPEEARRQLQEAAGPDVVVLAPARAQDQNGFVVRAGTAQRHGLRTISDLRPVAPQLVFGGPPECRGRRLCLRGLEEVYGLTFESFRPLDSSGPLTVAALLGDRVDVALLFTTDGALASDELVLLEDDKGLQPAENVVPVVRRAILDRHGPRVADALEAVNAALDTRALVELNRAVDRGDPVDAVAATWLAQEGLA
jgi:osmoprotectant transport system substrate-binding protein